MVIVHVSKETYLLIKDFAALPVKLHNAVVHQDGSRSIEIPDASYVYFQRMGASGETLSQTIFRVVKETFKKRRFHEKTS